MTGQGPPRIVITGASTGIGRACALRFADLGYRVLAGVRNAADGQAIRLERPDHIQPVLLDVTRAADITEVVTAAGDGRLAGLVNNAGIAVTGPLELVALDAWREQYEVNVIGLVAVTQAFLPLLRRDRGRIVNIGSIAGRSALPGSAPYDSSKFAVEGITDALRMEVHASGIHVSLVEPGSIATPLWQKTHDAAERIERNATAGVLACYARLLANLKGEAARSAAKAIPADKVADAVVHAITAGRPRARYLVGRDARLWLLLNLLPDRWRDRLILSQLGK